MKLALLASNARVCECEHICVPSYEVAKQLLNSKPKRRDGPVACHYSLGLHCLILVLGGSKSVTLRYMATLTFMCIHITGARILVSSIETPGYGSERFNNLDVNCLKWSFIHSRHH